MIQIGPLTIKPHELVTTILTEMSDALEAIQAGDYDEAHRILEAATQPEDQLSATDIPELLKDDLLAVRMYREIVQSGPPGLYRSLHGSIVAILANVLAGTQRNPASLNDRDRLAVLLMYVSECALGFNLEIPE